MESGTVIAIDELCQPIQYISTCQVARDCGVSAVSFPEYANSNLMDRVREGSGYIIHATFLIKGSAFANISSMEWPLYSFTVNFDTTFQAHEGGVWNVRI